MKRTGISNDQGRVESQVYEFCDSLWILYAVQFPSQDVLRKALSLPEIKQKDV